VIPLRPLGLSEVLDGSISTTRKHWRTVLPLSLLVAVLTETTTTAITWLSQNESNKLAAVLVGLVGLLFTLLAGLVVTALLTIVVSKAVIGEPVSIGGAWQAARGRLWPLLGLSLLIGLITGGIVLVGAIPAIVLALVSTDNGDGGNGGVAALAVLGLVAAIVVAGWMYVRLSLAAPALMLERQGVLAALSRSRRLVRGSWWRIFGINLLGSVLTGLLAGVIAMPFRIAAGAGGGGGPLGGFVTDPNNPQSLGTLVIIAIGGVIGATLTTPIKAGIAVLLYVDQRIRREALDLELARAAGLPEYGGAGWAGQTPGHPAQPGPQGPTGPTGVA
jgi:hypothetical protein